MTNDTKEELEVNTNDQQVNPYEISDVDAYASAIVPTTDDPTIPAFTFRVFLLGSFWCILLGSANAVLSFRTNLFAVDSMIASLLSYPMGIGLSKWLPHTKFEFKSLKFSINAGPFSVKEHVLISVMASAGAAGAYGIDNVIVQKSPLFIGNESIGFFESLAWVFATQFIGYGIAGISRRLLVKPTAMLWPNILSQVALYVTLHQQDLPSGKWKMPRIRFFWISFWVIFFYTWIPEYFITILQSLSWVCFVTPFSSFIRFLASSDYGNGVGLGTLTFDWFYISGNTLTIPFVYMCNYMVGNILYAWIVVPIIYLLNPFKRPQFESSYYKDTTIPRPIINSVSLFSNNGTTIKARDLYLLPSFNLDQQKYDQVKPLFITDYFAMNYFANFATLTAMFSHVGLWHGKDIKKQLKNAWKQVEENLMNADIHNRLMSAYSDVPDLWFIFYLLICIVLMVLVTSFTSFHMPIWSVFLGVGISMLVILPIGITEAVTGTRIYVNVLSQMIIGCLLPGKTIEVMAFKSLTTNSVSQALTLIADLKLGHYLKVPPIAMISCQLLGTFLGAITTTCMSWVVIHEMKDLLGFKDWKAIQYLTFYNAGAIWGAIGPVRFFGQGSPYEGLLYGFLIGFILPFLPWFGHRIYPSKLWTMIHIPLILYVSQTGSYQNFIIVPWLVNAFFQFYLFRYQHDWWKKYNYTLAASINGAVALCVLLITILRSVFHVNAPFWFGNPSSNDLQLDFYCF